jgi:UDP-N-acetylmuramate dehydrogenase
MLTIRENTSLRELNTFRLPVSARYFVDVTSQEALEELITHPVFRDHSRMILGGGSNVLFTKDVDGLVIRSAVAGRRIIEETDEEVVIEVGAGEVWHTLVVHCVDQNWGGIENLSLIPGSVGAAPIQNIGAYGVELKSVLKCIDGVELSTGRVRRMTPAECQFGYRDSVFKHTLSENFFISSVTLRLTKKNHRLETQYGSLNQMLAEKKITAPTIRDISSTVIEIRRSKLPDPAVIGNAGSFFKNPTIASSAYEALKKIHPSIPFYPIDNQSVKIPAGWLIERSGWKGKRIGDAGVHEKQALVIVNHGKATGEEILQLSEQIQADVLKKFGLTLITEVNIR